MPDPLMLSLVAAGVFVLSALAQSVSGFGGAMVAIPLLLMVVDASTAIAVATAVSLAMSARAWRREREHVDVALTRRLTVTGLLGMPLGLVVLMVVAERLLTLAIAGLVLVTVVATALHLRLPATPWAQRVAGTTSGVMLTSTGMNGPPLVLAMLSAQLTPRRARGTLQAVFAVEDLVAIGMFAVTGVLGLDALMLAAAGCLGVPFGWAVGDRVFHRLSAETFRRIVLVGLVAVALAAAIQGA